MIFLRSVWLAILSQWPTPLKSLNRQLISVWKKVIMKKPYITYFVIFLLICSVSFADKTIHTVTGYTIYYPETPYILKNVSLFALGSISDPNLLFELGLLLAEKSKKANAHGCVIGYVQLLSANLDSLQGHFDKEIAPFFSVNAFDASQTIKWIVKGMMAGGIFPVLSAQYGINDSLVFNLKYN